MGGPLFLLDDIPIQASIDQSVGGGGSLLHLSTQAMPGFFTDIEHSFNISGHYFYLRWRDLRDCRGLAGWPQGLDAGTDAPPLHHCWGRDRPLSGGDGQPDFGQSINATAQLSHVLFGEAQRLLGLVDTEQTATR